MATLFNTGIKIIFILSAIFFCIFAYVCLMWTNRKKTEWRNIIAGCVISVFYTFQIIFVSTLILGLVQIIVSRFFV